MNQLGFPEEFSSVVVKKLSQIDRIRGKVCSRLRGVNCRVLYSTTLYKRKESK